MGRASARAIMGLVSRSEWQLDKQDAVHLLHGRVQASAAGYMSSPHAQMRRHEQGCGVPWRSHRLQNVSLNPSTQAKSGHCKYCLKLQMPHMLTI